MTDLSIRSRDILARLAVHILDDLGCAAVTPSKAAWEQFDLPHPYRFGWMPPTAFGDNRELLAFSFCPELIAATTLWLDEEQLDLYLTAIEAFLDAMICNTDESPSVVYDAMQNTLYATNPAVLELISAVELRALDDAVVQGGTRPNP